MTSFSKYLLSKKLAELNQTQESIETLSLWILHHHKHATTVVKYWANEFDSVSEKQKIAFLFLVNEIVKTGKKKSHVYREEFKKVLPNTFHRIGKSFTDCNLIDQAHRIVTIWRRHGIFSKKIIDGFLGCLNDVSSASPIENAETQFDEPYDIKKIFLSFNAPTAEELIDSIEALSDAPSADEYTRDKIAAFPKKLFEAKAIYALKDTKEAAEYAEKLEIAEKLVENYNERLEAELEQRKKLQDMLLGYKETELERISDIEKKLIDIQKDLEQKLILRKELVRHRESLPDLKQFPKVTELPPLPSVKDLFKKQ